MGTPNQYSRRLFLQRAVLVSVAAAGGSNPVSTDVENAAAARVATAVAPRVVRKSRRFIRGL